VEIDASKTVPRNPTVHFEVVPVQLVFEVRLLGNCLNVGLTRLASDS